MNKHDMIQSMSFLKHRTNHWLKSVHQHGISGVFDWAALEVGSVTYCYSLNNTEWFHVNITGAAHDAFELHTHLHKKLAEFKYPIEITTEW